MELNLYPCPYDLSYLLTSTHLEPSLSRNWQPPALPSAAPSPAPALAQVVSQGRRLCQAGDHTQAGAPGWASRPGGTPVDATLGEGPAPRRTLPRPGTPALHPPSCYLRPDPWALCLDSCHSLRVPAPTALHPPLGLPPAERARATAARGVQASWVGSAPRSQAAGGEGRGADCWPGHALAVMPMAPGPHCLLLLLLPLLLTATPCQWLAAKRAPPHQVPG